MSREKYQFLSINVTILKYLGLWLEEDEAKKRINNVRLCAIIVFLSPSWATMVIDALYITDPEMNMVLKIQVLLAATCIGGAVYMAVCFYHNRSKIKTLVAGISKFSAYSKLDLQAVDSRASFFSKIMLGYSFGGLLVYCSFPIVLGTNCSKEYVEYMKKYGIACRTVVPVRIMWNYTQSPSYEAVMTTHLGLSALTCISIVNCTMMVCGLLEHAVSQLQGVRRSVAKIGTLPEDRIDEGVRFAVKHHCSVIDFIDDINKAFGSQLVMHITLTSIVIGLLGFEILLVNHRQALAYVLHLIGWFMVLYNVCHYGQLLIDESLGVAESAYFTRWYECPLRVQKDIKLIILRAQKPLTLKALNLGIMSEPTFLNVITSSYSYFALLLKTIKD